MRFMILFRESYKRFVGEIWKGVFMVEMVFCRNLRLLFYENKYDLGIESNVKKN